MAADFSIAELLEWARTKPKDEAYRFCDYRNCALTQFGRATGRTYLVGIGDVTPFIGKGKAFNALVLSRTFGELVSELEVVVEPSAIRRVWARLAGKTIGGAPVARESASLVTRLEELLPAPSDTWTKANAYLADIEQVTA
jgi:hypothetical protein